MKLGFIGISGIASGLLSAVKKDPGFRLVSACDINAENLDKVCKRFNCRRAGGVEQIAKDGDIEAVVIATPTHLHFDQFKICAENGKHVFVEEPSVTDPKEALEMIRISKRKKIVFMPGHNYRKSPACVEARRIIENDGIGNAHMCSAMVSCPRGYSLSPAEWRYSREKTPLLPFTQMGIVYIDMVMHFWGAPEWISAFMVKRDGRGEAPDSGSVICRFRDGKIAHIGCSYVCWTNYSAEIWGSKGSVCLDGRALTIKNDQGVTRKTLPPLDEQHAELKEFRECIENATEPSVNGADAYHLAEFYRCVAESVETGKAARFCELGGLK
ncbi:MAG: Gfo/Idh/MocA family oxidoreductase [Verrucomicrobiae bacterium]|nr:Gfo/Idh/MocA family oxidoreductase [Verrucomicrobiae bacterium]